MIISVFICFIFCSAAVAAKTECKFPQIIPNAYTFVNISESAEPEIKRVATIMTTRYSQGTWSETLAYRAAKQIACIYAPSTPIASSIIHNSLLFVIEMNNSHNQVEGIGLLRNRILDKTCRVYADSTHNKYVYVGKYHVSRAVMQEIAPELLDRLDQLLFRGKTHSKRGIGISKFPEKLVDCAALEFEIRKLFTAHYSSDRGNPVVKNEVTTNHAVKCQ